MSFTPQNKLHPQKTRTWMGTRHREDAKDGEEHSGVLHTCSRQIIRPRTVLCAELPLTKETGCHVTTKVENQTNKEVVNKSKTR